MNETTITQYITDTFAGAVEVLFPAPHRIRRWAHSGMNMTFSLVPFMFGYPPEGVWVKLGNGSTADVEKVLRRNVEAIKEFHEDDNAAFLSLS